MASSGPNSGGTFALDFAVGGANIFSLSSLGASDDTYANNVIGSGTITWYAVATNFGFAIPTGATIDGILVEWERHQDSTGGGIKDYSVRLYKAGALAGSDYASGTEWANADAYASYGGAADLWGTTWTVAQINATDFGAALSIQDTVSGSNRFDVDHVRITVYYTAAASGGTVPRRRSSTRTLRAM